jgi:hypothetical protein
MARIEALEELARNLVGDDLKAGGPDLFFVSVESNIQTVTTDYELAKSAFHALNHRPGRLVECALENRTFGVIASREPHETSGRLVLREDYYLFERQRERSAA